MSEPAAFDVCGPLPSGVTVLEASAGTGKTSTIAALATRYIAGGVPLERMLLITFTRLATGELRERVRARLLQAERALVAALAGGDPGADAVDRLLAGGPPDEVRERRDRIARAVAGFDAGTISTTHGFCLEALGSLGIAGDVEPGCVVEEDAADLLAEVVDDLHVRRWALHGGAVLVDRAQAGEVARAAVAHVGAPILPEGVADPRADPTPAATRARLATLARDELEARKRRLGVLTYDDLLSRLRDTLAGPDGTWAAQRLRERYAIVLIDEFQDTDPVQWEIVERAFVRDAPADGRALVLIGDPKQAIYAFRGADVHAYLGAARTAGAQATLRTNWRSDQALVSALDAFFDGARLGHDEIVHRDVVAPAAHQAPRLLGAPAPAALRVRVVHRHDPTIGTTAKGYASARPAQEHVARDLAAQVVELLSSGATREVRDAAGATVRTCPVQPGDVAVLVRYHWQAAVVQDALRAAGVPAVIGGAGSVFATEAAREWLTLLQALERPASALRARSAALTPFLGRTPRAVAEATDDDWEAVHRRLHRWARVLRTRGVASLLEQITLEERLPARVLAVEGGERRMTDLRHIGQLLHTAAVAERLGTTALTGWLRARIRAAAQEGGDEERTRRLESDAEAVQVLTIHGSKGLEFPVVLLPFLWDQARRKDSPRPVAFHDPARGRRVVDVALDGREYDRHRELAWQEEDGEDLRLAYVALTRARHQVVVWWAGSWEGRRSALSRLAFGRDDTGAVRAHAPVPSDEDAAARFAQLAARAPGCIAVERSDLPAVPPSWSPPLPAPAGLAAARFDRPIDGAWRRASYSAIVAGAYEARVASEPEGRALDDEAPLPAPAGAPDPELALPSPMAELPAGTQFGTLVHRVLEQVDFAAPDLEAQLTATIEHALLRRPLAVDPAELARALRGVLETPLGPALDGLRLADVAAADRLDELEFELPLVGGDAPSGRLALDDLAAVLAEHTPPGSPLHGYAQRLADRELVRELRGYLTGSIDVVLRLPGGRFAIADYKTNRLAPAGEPLTAWHHRPAALAEAMADGHYGLQALLYAVALHRYLRRRVPGYDPDEHVAGVLYLFVRGMTGADTPAVDGQPCGVVHWRPGGALLTALSDVLDRGAR
ncbi:MAG TPA: UvrD-helicase domain-containing protein [Baekduia sp.]|nr:UvrD-helicase domain-containing protein [Baekduia sp.]